MNSEDLALVALGIGRERFNGAFGKLPTPGLFCHKLLVIIALCCAVGIRNIFTAT